MCTQNLGQRELEFSGVIFSSAGHVLSARESTFGHDEDLADLKIFFETQCTHVAKT
jgi:hypothetical protein